MLHKQQRFPHVVALLTLIVLLGSMLSAPVLANQPFATPVADADPPAAEVEPVEQDERVIVDAPAGESVPPEEELAAESATSLTEPSVMAAIEPLTTMYLTITEATGRTVVFPDGQTACFSILLDPPVEGGNPYTTHCIGDIDGLADVYGGMPDVRVTTYAVLVASNSTACDFSVGDPVVTELGSDLSQVDIAIGADCPEDPSTPAGPLDGFGITLSDSTGLDRTYPGLLCMDVVATPPLPVPLSRPICLDASYRVAITNQVGVVFPRDASYDLVVASNATGCTPSWSAWREEFVPPGILVVGLIDVVLTCDEDPVPAATYDAVAFSLTDASGTGRTYPGEICLTVQITPVVTVPGMGTLCYSESAAAFGWDAAGAVLPRDSVYEGVVVSNTTGCAASWTFREVLSVDGPLIAVVDFVLTCDPLASESYAGVGVTLTDSTGVDRTYDGEICIDVAITPAVEIPGAAPQCFSASYAQSGYPAAGAILPRDSTYEGIVVSNTTGCDATWTTREMVIPPAVPIDVEPVLVDGRDELPADPPPSSSSGGVMIVVDVVITCDEEPGGDLFQVGIAFSDVRDTDFTYPGEVCVEVRVDPVIGASTTGTYCTDSTFRYVLLPGADWSHLSTSTYTTTIVSNATGCGVTFDPYQTWTGPLLPPVGHIQVWIDCDPPDEEPEPSVTATATPTSTVTPDLTPTATTTTTPVPGETPGATGTSPAKTPPAADPTATSSGSQDVGGGTGPSGSGTAFVATLPNTGTGEVGMERLSVALITMTGLALFAVAAGGIVRWREAHNA